MIIVSDNTATDLMYAKVGGLEPVNQLAQSYGLKNTRAVLTGEAWFKAIAAAPSRDQFHREGKTPFGLSSPRDIGKLLEMIERGQAVSKKSSDLMPRCCAAKYTVPACPVPYRHGLPRSP